MKQFIVLFSAFFLCFSCGYHSSLDHIYGNTHRYSISIPYVKGDIDGGITDALVKEIAKSPRFFYVNDQGDLELQAVVKNDQVEVIGFQYDQNEISGKTENRLKANEERRTLCLEITLTSSHGKIIYGPTKVSASVDYDFIISDVLKNASFINPEGIRERTLFFSLGQLDSKEGAYYSSANHLFIKLAQKIAEGLFYLDFPEF